MKIGKKSAARQPPARRPGFPRLGERAFKARAVFVTNWFRARICAGWVKRELQSRHSVDRVAGLGSFTRGTQGPTGDLDLLVSSKQPPSLLKFVWLENWLSDSLGVEVDLVMEETLQPNIGRRIFAEIVPLQGLNEISRTTPRTRWTQSKRWVCSCEV